MISVTTIEDQLKLLIDSPTGNPIATLKLGLQDLRHIIAYGTIIIQRAEADKQ